MKKILLILISIYSFSFAGYIYKASAICQDPDRPIGQYLLKLSGKQNYSNSTSCYNALNAEHRPIYENLCHLSSPSFQYRYATFNACISSTADRPYEEVLPNNCTISNNNLICYAPIDNGYYDDNMNKKCNSGYSAVGFASDTFSCMVNPDNGYYDDNAEKQCNDGYSNNSYGNCSNEPHIQEDDGEGGKSLIVPLVGDLV